MLAINLQTSIVKTITVVCAVSLIFSAWSARPNDADAIQSLLAMKPDGVRQWLAANPRLVNRDLWQKVNSEGHKLHEAGDYELAKRAHTVALLIAAALSNNSFIGESRHQLGRAENGQGKAEEALRHYRSALAAFASDADADKRYLAYTYKDIAITFRDRRDFEQGSEYAVRSLNLGESLNDARITGLAYLVLGTLYRNQGDVATAIGLISKSRGLFLQNNDEKYLIDALFNLGGLYAAQSDYHRALPYYRQAEELAVRLNLPFRLAWVYFHLGMFHSTQGDDDLMKHYLVKSLDIARRIGDVQLAIEAQLRLTGLNLTRGEITEANQLLDNILPSAHSINYTPAIAYANNLRGVANGLAGDYAQAVKDFNQALSVAALLDDADFIAAINLNFAELMLKKDDPDRALPLIEAAVSSAQKTTNADLQVEGLTLQGEALIRLRHTSHARNVLRRAIALVEAGRVSIAGDATASAGFLHQRASAYELMMMLDMLEGKVSSALLTAEAIRGRALLDVLLKDQPNQMLAMSESERQHEITIYERLGLLNLELRAERKMKPESRAVLQENLKVEQAQLTGVQNAIRARINQQQVRAAPQAAITSFAALDSVLPATDTATLLYALTPQHVYLFVLTRDSAAGAIKLNSFALPVAQSDVEKRVNDFRQRLASLDFAYRRDARQLYELLIKQSAPLLVGKRKLCIIPVKGLWELPFQVLLDEQNRHLLDTHEVYLAPSLSVMSAYRRHSHSPIAPKTLLTVSYFPSAQFGLTGIQTNSSAAPREADDETNALVRLYGAANAVMLRGREASEAKFKAIATRHRTVHIAAHGVLNNRQPLESYLQLAASGNEDGRLTAREVMNLNLDADLAVLSSCESARGRVSRGEGTLGMSWAFHIAGVSTSVVSQWKIDSAGTAAIMIEFHRRLQAGESKSKSLRNAMLSVKGDARRAHPFFWASFVLIGDDA